MTNQRLLGVTVLGDYLLSEGGTAVLENLLRIGVTAVATNPTVTAPALDGQGSFQPPADAGSSPRVFDRPLFGKTSLWVRSGASFQPNADLYAHCKYGPRKTNDLTAAHGHVIGDFIERALDAGLKVYWQIGAAEPTGLLDEDRPRLPNGELPQNRVANTASLACEHVHAYNRAYVQELVAAYPGVTGFRPDWPESPCYTLGECFQDFSPHVENWAKENGFDFHEIQSAAAGLYDHLHGKLTTTELKEHRDLFTAVTDGAADSTEFLRGLSGWFSLKRKLSERMLKSWREILTEAGGAELELSANAFMPEYHRVTGFDFDAAVEVCHAVSPKLYTMHWSQMVSFWGNPLLRNNPELDECTLVDTLCDVMKLHTDDERLRGKHDLSDYGYPAPDEPHPISSAVQSKKVQQVIDTVNNRAKVTPLVHGYGPCDDFARRLQLVADSAADGVWINRYGYLGDDKLAEIGRIWGGRG